MLYSEIRPQIRTGDIVLFSGTGDLSQWIKRLCRSRWSHVGRCLTAGEDDIVLLWESTTLSNLIDLDTNKRKGGTQVVALSDRINSYDGEIAIRHLHPHITPEQNARLFELRRAFIGRDYQKSLIELLRSVFDGIAGKNKSNLNDLFCSELVAAGDIAMGLLDEALDPPNEYTPANYDVGGLVDQRMTDVFEYGPLVQVDREGRTHE